jgi:hypothetical protein
MMTGLLDDSTKLVEALAARNPILAAAAVSSANRVDGSLLARLEQRWIELLEHVELSHRIVACSCLVLASMKSPQVIQSLVAFALDNSYVGIPALGKLGAPDAVALELAERARNLSDNEYEEQERTIGEAIKELQSSRMVNVLFEQWRASPPDSSARHRFERLLATVDRSLLDEELQRIRSGTSDPARAADAERALVEGASWDGFAGGISIGIHELSQMVYQAQREYTDRMAEAVTAMGTMDDQELAAGLRSSDPAVRAAAATLAAERQAPVGAVILESILRQDGGQSELISALVSLWGEQTAVSRLVEGSREKCWCIGTLNPDLGSQLKLGELSEAVKAEIERLGVRPDLRIEGHEIDCGTSIWNLVPSSQRWLYQLRVSPARLEFYDCNVAVRAFSALAEIPGEASLTELRRAIEHDEPNVQKIAIDALVKRGDSGFATRLIAKLSSATSADFIDAALAALGELRDREALSLINDLLVITHADGFDVHHVWGKCRHRPGWWRAIHQILVNLNADSDIQHALDNALALEDPVPKVAALDEFSWWFAETDLGPERDVTWRTPERLQRLLDLALRDSTQSVRTAAAGALREVKSEVVQKSLAEALADNSAEVQVAAAVAVLQMNAHELYGRVAECMVHVAKADQSQDLRRRAGEVLTAIPGGVEPFYQPIHAELGRGELESALKLIEATLEILPEDANLFWLRAMRSRTCADLTRRRIVFSMPLSLRSRPP